MDVDLAPPAFLHAVEVVEAVVGDHRLRVAQDLLAIPVVHVEQLGTSDDGDDGLGEGETAGIDGLLAVADHEQAVRFVADECMQQLQTHAGQVPHAVIAKAACGDGVDGGELEPVDLLGNVGREW